VQAARSTTLPEAVAGAGDAVILTVLNSVGGTDTTFTGAHNVTVSAYAGRWLRQP